MQELMNISSNVEKMDALVSIVVDRQHPVESFSEEMKEMHMAIVFREGKWALGKAVSSILVKVFGEVSCRDEYNVTDLSFTEASFLKNFLETLTDIFSRRSDYEMMKLQKFMLCFSRSENKCLMKLATDKKLGNEVLIEGMQSVLTVCRH